MSVYRNGVAVGGFLYPLVLAVTLSACIAGEVGAQVPACIGDCNADRHVTVDELVRGVNIALGAQPVSTCPKFDRNQNDAVTVDELVAAVTSALQGCFPPVLFRGRCLRPGPSGLIPCTAGSAVRLSLCLDRSRCLFDATARRVLQSITTTSDGAFSLPVSDEAILNALLLLESDIAAGVSYRSFAFGPASAGGAIDNLAVDPRSEAVARIIDENGFQLFSDAGIRELIEIILAALSGLDFSGTTPQTAADLAASTARQNPTVQEAITTRRFTPTPSPSATRTASATTTPTTPPTPTITNTRTITSTPTSTWTFTPTPTLTSTPSVTSTQSQSPTATRTFTPSATPTITLTPTPSSSPTATLPPLNLAIEVNPDPVRPGETVEVSFTITNTGGSNLGPITLEMVLPSDIQPFLDTLASGTGRCGVNQLNTCNPGDTMTWHFIGSLAPGEGITLRVPPIIAPGTPNGTQIEFAGIAGAPGLTAMRAYTATVQSGMAAPFDLALNQESDPVEPGALLTYTAAFGFRAVVGQADAILRVRPPAGTSFVSATDGGAPVEGGDIEWLLGTLTPGDGGIRRFTVRVDDTLPNGALLDAQATIRRSDESGAKRANAVNRVQVAQPVKVAIETNPDPARAAGSAEVKITVTNASNTAASVTLDFIVPDLVDTFPDGDTLGGATCGPFTPGSPCERRARVRWTLTVPAKDGVTVRLDPIVSMGAPNGALISFQARVVNLQGSYVASARSALHVDASNIWDLLLDTDRDPVGPSENYTYRLTVGHRAADPDPVDGTLELSLPVGVTVIEAAGGTVLGQTIQWTLATLTPGDSTSRDVTVQVDTGIPPATLLAAEAVVREASSGLEAKRVRTIIRAVPGSPLALSLEVHPDPVRPGEVLETELTATNTGAMPLTGVLIEARVPEGTDAFFMSLATGASCSAVTLQCAPHSVVRWTRSVIPPGGKATVRMPPIVSLGTPDGTLLRLHARAGVDAGGRNAALSRTVRVDGDTPFDLAVTESSDPVIGGQMFAYTLHFGRRAATSSTDTVLRMHLAPGVFFVSASDGGTLVGDDVAEWDLGTVTAGEVGTRQLNVVVDSLLEGTPLRAQATIREADDPSSEKRADIVTVVGTPTLAFSLAAAPDPVTPGETVTVSLSVTNTGAAAVDNVSVEGIVPPEANSFQDTATTGGGTCGPFSSNACAPRARVIWNIPTVPAGQTVTVTMPPMIRADVPPGSVVRFVGRFQQNISTPPILATDAVTVQEAM